MARTRRVPESRRHIVAVGGGYSPPVVLEYILKLTGKKNPKLLVINTATGDRPESLLMMYRKVAGLGCTITSLEFFARTPRDLETLVFSNDAVWVGGGNTKSMLAVWRDYGLDEILAEAWRRGIVLSGSSAGGICWFESCCTDSFAEDYAGIPALGFLPGSCCPHYDGEVGRPATYHRLISEGQLTDGIAIDEGVGVHYIGSEIAEVVTPSPNSGAYTVTTGSDGEIRDTPLAKRFIGTTASK